MSSKAEKNRRLAKKLYSSEPEFYWESKEQQDNELAGVLGWYAANTGKKEQKQYALDYFKTVDKKIYNKLKSIEDWRFCSFGSLCRLLSKDSGFNLDWTESPNYFQTRLNKILSHYENTSRKASSNDDNFSEEEQEIIEKEKISNAIMPVLTSIDSAIDTFIKTKQKVKLNLDNILSENKVPKKYCDDIVNEYSSQISEIEYILSNNDKELKESYSNFSKPELRELLGLYNGFIKDINSYKKINKTVKKRKIKPEKVVSKLKYQKECNELNIKSIDPKKILAAKTLIVYNTKYKILQVYTSKDGETLWVKGTTLQNFDENKSYGKTIRHPECDVAGKKFTQKSIEKLLSLVKTKEQKNTGRINENCVIMEYFK